MRQHRQQPAWLRGIHRADVDHEPIPHVGIQYSLIGLFTTDQWGVSNLESTPSQYEISEQFSYNPWLPTCLPGGVVESKTP